MTKVYQVIHKKSNVLVEGQPKLPSASTVEYGEIAINYAKGGETLSIKNANNEIVTFSSDEKILSAVSAINETIEENEMVVAEALNDLNTRISGITVPTKTSDLTNDSGFITGYTETDPTVPAWAKAQNKPSYTASEVGAMATSERSNYATTAHTHEQYSTTAHTHEQYSTTAHTHTASEVGAMATSERNNYLVTGTTLDNIADGTTRKLSNYSTTAHTHSQYATTAETANYLTSADTQDFFDDAEYDSNTKRINFKQGNTVKKYIDATDFIKDGMVDTVEIATPTGGTNSGVTCLVVTFNTDAGKEDIEIPLSNIFNPNNYLATGTTLDSIADGTTRKLSNYSTTGHTHSEYLGTGATLDNIADGSTRKLSNYLPITGGTLINEGNGNYIYLDTERPGIVVYGDQGDSSVIIYETHIAHKDGNNRWEYSLPQKNGTLAVTSDIPTSLSGLTNDAGFITSADTQDFVTSASTVFVKASDYEDDEEVIAQAFNDINDRLNDLPDDFLTTATTIPTTAAEVGAMATSERSNYLATGTTLDNIADGTTRKLSNYSTTGHTHSEYLTTATTIYEKIYTVDSDYDHMFPSASNTTGDSPYNISRAMFDEMVADVEGGKKPVIRFQRVADGSEQYIEYTFQNMVLMEGSYQLEFVSPGVMGYPNSVAGLTLNANDFNDDPPYQSFFQHFVVPTESSIQSSGFTKNAVTGINVNGTAVTVSNGVASVTVPTALSDLTDDVVNGNYLPLSGGTVTGSLRVSGSTASLTVKNSDSSSVSLKGDGITFPTIKLMPPGSPTVFGVNNIKFQQKDGTVALTSDIPTSLSGLTNDAGFITSAYTGFSSTAHTHSDYSLTSHTHTASEVGAMATSERSNYLATGTTLDNIADGTTRKLSNYSTTGHSHTAAEVGAMATSERSNYLATGTTLDNIADGTTRKLSNYSTTGHSHTAAEVGAMATSERSNYLTTATTIPSTAAEVGAMATSERSNYLATGTTLDNIADGTTRKLSNYSTTGHTHSEYLTTATTIPTETSITSSGFTKNGITGINVNGTATTVTNGVADITIPSGLPAVTSSDNGKVLMVVNGVWSAATPTIIYTGNSAPDNSLGNDGDIYLQTT